MNSDNNESTGEFILYQTEDGKTRLEVRFQGETARLSKKQMAELFQKDGRTISEHIRNVFEEGELNEDSVIRNFRITAADGKTYQVVHYNLDVIISVGYRIVTEIEKQFSRLDEAITNLKRVKANQSMLREAFAGGLIGVNRQKLCA